MRKFDRSSLVPSEFAVERIETSGEATVVTVYSRQRLSSCPGCGEESSRIHSRYRRRLADLPMAGRPVTLLLHARRFYCAVTACDRRIFAERIEGPAPWGRRTARLDQVVHHLGLVLGGRPATGLARRLMLPVSNDTLLRVVRRQGKPPIAPLRVVVVDDWAWRRNCRYATIVCDLERRQTIALLPDREPATARTWLAGQGQVEVVARDRGGGYALAAAQALPHAIQVADRWHLIENASHAFLDAVRESMRQIRGAIGTATVNPKLLTAAEKLRYEGYLRREETNTIILKLVK